MIPTHDNNLSAISSLRRQLSLTLAEMGERCGISKSQMHEVERTGRASLPVALAIEALAAQLAPDTAIDAADLNDDVRAARHGVGITLPCPALSPGNVGTNSRAAVGAVLHKGEAA